MTNHRATPVSQGNVEDIDSPDATPAEPALNQSREATEGFRLSPQQRHLWRLHQADGGQAYVAQCAVRIEGPWRQETLRAALKDVIQKHEILRTRYLCSTATELPEQVIDESTSPCLDEYRVTDGDAQAFEAKCAEVLKEFVHQPRDLSDHPLVSFSLVTDSSERSALLISVPALSMDAPGLNCLVGQICRSYEACSKNEQYGDDPLQYADLAEWQNELLEGEETAAGRAFWEDLESGGDSRYEAASLSPSTSRFIWLLAPACIADPWCRRLATHRCHLNEARRAGFRRAAHGVADRVGAPHRTIRSGHRGCLRRTGPRGPRGVPGPIREIPPA